LYFLACEGYPENRIFILRGADCKPEWTILTKMEFSSIADEPVKVHDGFRRQLQSRGLTNPFQQQPEARGLINPFRRKPESRRGWAELITPENEMTLKCY
jgi:hypothetical protein